MDAGTLYQLRNLINRRKVTRDPNSNVSASEDFFLTVVEVHILSACMTVFEMTPVNSAPSQRLFSPESEKKATLHTRSAAVNNALDTHVDFLMNDEGRSEPEDDKDHVCEYARDVLTLGLLYMEFADAIREGDGGRILRCWRYFLVVFKVAGRKNYSIEAFNLLSQHNFIFSERMHMQLLWNRTVNVYGRPGKNVPCDLHMEHLNRECKASISGLGAT